jgi:hypothetical protein
MGQAWDKLTNGASVRLEVEASISKAYAETAPCRIRKSAIVGPFLSRGVGRSTLYRWVDQWLEARKPAQTMIRAAQKAAAVRKHRAMASGELPERAAAKLAARVIARAAVLPAVEVVAAQGMMAVDVIRRLQFSIEAAEQVMVLARHADGTVKAPRMLLAASDHLRRSLETAAKLHKAMRSVADIERFHDEVIGIVEDVAKEYPPAAELLISRLRLVVSRWRG